eukprot:CAMPEP_0202867162 /NCGR_PEP_ID=MMETSP1391-20130828/8833_1 /ASSEMBLY_ACC=CAM_ASM_000867 /TAXON_ID=1034604 /ORGANISM="Chlamydomonas leiostraca, Strain SAG 11-49" /LENGTH=159 /DNA_ID=CAMNT_0049547175 /DNA_START=165 /DNA_END=644 /DNA_ORIENTATION=-
MFLGCVAVHWTKKLLRALPVVGVLTAPVLDLLPTIVVGPAIGAAVVYGLDEGDLTAARHKVKQIVRDASREVDAVVADVRDELSELQRRQAAAGRRLLPVLEDTVQGMEREVVPVLERQYKQARRQVESWHRDEGGSSGGRDLAAQLQQAAAGRSSGWR